MRPAGSKNIFLAPAGIRSAAPALTLVAITRTTNTITTFQWTAPITVSSSPDRYPDYLVMQSFQTYDGNVRLTYRPINNVSLVSRYEYQHSIINTTPDSISGLGESQSSTMNSQIIAQNVSWTPWSRLCLQGGFNYVLSTTQDPDLRLHPGRAQFPEQLLDPDV